MVDYAVLNSEHTLFNNKFFYMIPFGPDIVDSLKNNRFNGLYRLLPPVTKISITSPTTIN